MRGGRRGTIYRSGIGRDRRGGGRGTIYRSEIGRDRGGGVLRSLNPLISALYSYCINPIVNIINKMQ